MSLETVRTLHAYNDWANDRVLDCAETLKTAQFLADDDTPWGSIRNQFVHLASTHRSWLSWADNSMSGEEAYNLRLDPEAFPDAGSIRTVMLDIRSQTWAFLDRATEDDMNRRLTAESGDEFAFSLPVWQIMIHIANHSMQHRTEITMSLTRRGASPGDLDYLFFALEN